MSSRIQLQVKPRRVRCDEALEPLPFQFTTAADAGALVQPKRLAHLPFRFGASIFKLVGLTIDMAFFLVGIATWCAVHLVLWSYAFDMGPAADCFSLPCPPVVQHRVLLASAGLAVVTFVGARILKRLGHKATSLVMIILVTFDVAATLLLTAGLI
ncbi:MAG: hypothetical protein H7287_05280 [Thermoleophilia bacterium]|nr:hypothetical protein [Thermoleophilia bacterium]